MTDTFLDNQEVTAQDLNNIAIDLGYAEYSHFPGKPAAVRRVRAEPDHGGFDNKGGAAFREPVHGDVCVQQNLRGYGHHRL